MTIPVSSPQMSSMVREALKRYGDFKAAAALRRMEKKGFTAEQMEQIRLAEARVSIIQSWLDMLSYGIPPACIVIIIDWVVLRR